MRGWRELSNSYREEIAALRDGDMDLADEISQAREAPVPLVKAIDKEELVFRFKLTGKQVDAISLRLFGHTNASAARARGAGVSATKACLTIALKKMRCKNIAEVAQVVNGLNRMADNKEASMCTPLPTGRVNENSSRPRMF